VAGIRLLIDIDEAGLLQIVDIALEAGGDIRD